MDGFKSTTELRIQTDMDPSNGSSSCLLQRKIEFHPARKPFAGFINGTADFRIETLNPTLDPKRPGSGPCQSAMSCKKPDGSDVLETALDPELSFGITVRKIGAGLENLGNTCFLNSVLQCLTYTEPLAAYLQSGKHRNSCHIAGFCALCAIQKHVSRALQATGRILAPKDLVSNLRCISRNFRNARQEDAHEYMVNLLESMHKCCLPSGVPSESQSAYEKSLVHKIFGGRLRSQVKCLQCSHCSNTFDPFLDLSLELVKADSLHKALTHFTAAELLDGGERQYQCEQCKQKVRALKQLTVNKAPYVLSIHLKRFRAHDSGKIDKKVQFGPTLDMKPFVSGSYEGDLKYTLYGVLVHCGWSIHSGHYYCFVRTSSGMWYSLDDNRVFQVNERTVLEQKAYMLFYVRDRKNTVPRKQMEVVQKENLKAKATVNKTSPIFPQISKEQVPNGLTENKLKGANSYIAMTQKDAAAYPYKENPVKEPAPQQTNGQMMVKHSVVEEDHAVKPTSSVPLLEGTSGAPSALNPHVGVLQASTPCLNNNAKTPHLQGRSTSSGAKSRECGKDKNLSENSKAPVMTSPNCNSPQIVFHQLVTNKASQKNIIITDAVIPNIRLSGDSTDNMSSGILSTNPAGVSGEDTDEAQTLNKSTCENSQVGATSVVSASWNLRNKKAGNNGQIMVLESVDLPTPVGLINGSSEMKVTESTTHRKLKKLQKCKVKKLHVGSKFFMVSLGLCKKKKRKRSKQCTLNTQNPSKELLLDGHNYPSDLGPSTSETLKTDSMDSAHSLRKVDNGITLKNLSKCNGDQLMDATVREFGERIYQNGSVPAAYQQSQKSSASVLGANQHDLREANSSKEGEKGVSQNEMMHVLTRGLEETVVAPWDDRGLPPYIEESKSESVSIGYVLDEWDEEYDRGKRKKVRHNKEGFGGPNPFQLLAIKKTQQLKKAKSKHPNSGNLPFRI